MFETKPLVKGTSALAESNRRVLKDAAAIAMATVSEAFPEMVETEDSKSTVFDIVCSTLNRNIKKSQ